MFKHIQTLVVNYCTKPPQNPLNTDTLMKFTGDSYKTIDFSKVFKDKKPKKQRKLKFSDKTDREDRL